MEKWQHAAGLGALPYPGNAALSSVGPALAFGTAIAAGTLCVCFAAFALAQRRQARLLSGVLANMEALHTEAQEASCVSREAAWSVAQLARKALDGEETLRGWAGAIIEGQERSASLTAQCVRLAEQLPSLLKDATEAAHAQARIGMDAARGRLNGTAAEIETVSASLRDGVKQFSIAATSQAALAQRCDAAVGSVPMMVRQAIATLQAHAGAALDGAARRVEDGAGGLTQAGMMLKQIMDAAAADAVAQSECRDAAARLARQCEQAASKLPRAVDQTIRGALVLTAQQGRTASDALNARLQDSVLCVEAAAAELHGALGKAAEAQETQIAALDAALARAGDIVGVLPEVTSALAEGAASVRREGRQGARSMAEAEAALTRSATDATQAAELGLARLALVADRLEARGQALAETAAIQAREAAALSASAAQMRQAALEHAQAMGASSGDAARIADLGAAIERISATLSRFPVLHTARDEAAARVTRAAIAVASAGGATVFGAHSKSNGAEIQRLPSRLAAS